MRNVSATSWREQVTFDENDIRFVLDQHTVCRYIRPSNWTHHPNFESTSLCSYSSMLHVQWKSSKYYFYSLQFQAIRTRTHILPHSRWACLPLYLQNCLFFVFKSHEHLFECNVWHFVNCKYFLTPLQNVWLYQRLHQWPHLYQKSQQWPWLHQRSQ